jgi:hypothetical protein
MKQTYPTGVPCLMCNKKDSTQVVANGSYCIDCYKVLMSFPPQKG